MEVETLWSSVIIDKFSMASYKNDVRFYGLNKAVSILTLLPMSMLGVTLFPRF
jgi:hypothetical protein